MKILALLLLASAIALTSHAQTSGFFHPLLNGKAYFSKQAPKKLALSLGVTGGDSSTWEFRPVVGLGAVIASSSQLVAGTGVSYEHDTWSASSGWYTNFSVMLMAWAIGNAGPDATHPTAGFGPAVGLFNKTVVVGGLYNVTTKQMGLVLNFGIGFNNGATTVTTQ